jgi:bifunctional DNA-binding transcriptional regulator/antitoxin component of YhaV-PrlF toxin-antitoxin module
VTRISFLDAWFLLARHFTREFARQDGLIVHSVYHLRDVRITGPALRHRVHRRIKIRRKLQLKEGDKLLFIERNGEIMINNASATAIVRVQDAFAGAAKDFGVSGVDDVQRLVDEVRYGTDK